MEVMFSWKKGNRSTLEHLLMNLGGGGSRGAVEAHRSLRIVEIQSKMSPRNRGPNEGLTTISTLDFINYQQQENEREVRNRYDEQPACSNARPTEYESYAADEKTQTEKQRSIAIENPRTPC